MSDDYPFGPPIEMRTRGAQYSGMASLHAPAAAAMAALDKVQPKIDRLRTALGYAREKLCMYRARQSGEYLGGIEFTALIKMIDEALRT